MLNRTIRGLVMVGALIVASYPVFSQAVSPQGVPDLSGLSSSDRQQLLDRVQQMKNSDRQEQQPVTPPVPTTPTTTAPAAAPKQSGNAAPTKPQARPHKTDEATHEPVPEAYDSIPSLKDLYAQEDQASGSSGSVERFGISMFRSAPVSNTEDVPVTSDYLLGPGDVVNVDVWGGANEHLSRLIDSEGRVSLPDVGTIVLAHQTVLQAQTLVSAALRREYNEVQADVSVARLRKVRVYVVGDVVRPGAYVLPGNSTVLNVLTAAGGPSDTGSMRKLRHLRGAHVVREIDLYDFMLHGLDSTLESFQNGDTLVVPTVAAQVAVTGAVRRPAVYELRDERSLRQVLDLAGGVPVGGALGEIDVDRIVPHEGRTTVTIHLPVGATSSAESEQQLRDFSVQDGDRVNIRSILPYREQTVYLVGHVFRPGKLQFHPGMTVADIVHSYQNLLPEPADRGEIIRLVPPDFKPRVLTFSLPEVIDHSGDPIPLQPFDTVRIFGRYEYDPPKVSIRGEVLRPGDYPLQQQMTAADLVRFAGGFKRSAYTQAADLSRYEVHDGQQILTEHSDVPIADALAGKPDTDVLLHARDVLTIRQVSGWADVGTTVTIGGEVRYPGSYGIEKAERLSSILKRAGGFRESAYPPGAVLEREQVRDFEERSRKELLSKLQIEAALADSGTGTDESKKQAASLAERNKQIQLDLMSHPASGRLVISISRDVEKWENTPADLEIRPGDQIVIPKRPEFVLVSGEVFNKTALTYVPGKRASWYLRAAGGPTRHADEKTAFVIRANGQVVGQSRNLGFWSDHVMDTRMEPGDTLVIPEKVVTGNSKWKDFAQAAQVMSAMSIAARVATSF